MLPPPAPIALISVCGVRFAYGPTNCSLVSGTDEVLDEAHVGAGAAHVAGDEVGEVEPPAEMGGRRHAPRRAGQHGGDRQPASAFGRRDPAVRRHDKHRTPVAARGDGSLEPGQVTVDEGADVRVEGSGVEALVLPELRKHLARSGDEPGAGSASLGALAGERGDRPLVVRVRIAVQEAHRDRDAGRQALHRGARLVQVERAQDTAVPGRALVDLQRAASRNEGRGLPGGDVVQSRTVRARDLEHVPKPGRGQHPDLGAAPFEDRVRADGDAVDEARHRCEVDAETLEHVENRARGVPRRGGGFRVANRPGRIIEHGRVREGSAHVHADAVSILSIGHVPLPFLAFRPAREASPDLSLGPSELTRPVRGNAPRPGETTRTLGPAATRTPM